MKEHLVRTNIISVLVGIVIGYIIGFSIGYSSKRIEDKIDNIKPIDTSYNRTVLDSIQYNIDYRDTTIYNLKIKMKYEIEEVIAASDSDAVMQFKELCSME